jgi:dTDP-4-amino-4,6-dideoxygalactose transaminase
LKKLKEINELRKKNATAYTEFLESVGKNHVNRSLFDDHIFIRYPLLVNDRERFREEAEKENIILGEWFEDPIYPAYDSLTIWKVKTEDLPNAMYVCKHVVNLPTEEGKINIIIEYINNHKKMIL